MTLSLKRLRRQLVWLCLVFIASTVSAADHKNVLLICIDDLRPVMGCYGGAATTPHIDELAKSSAVFTRHYNQWPVCGPSRASMLGGLRPDSTGIYEIGDSWKISKRPTTHPTLPRYFKDNGYRTLSFGKVYHGKGNGKGYGWSDEPWKLDWTCYVDFDYVEGKKKRWRPAYEIYDGPDSIHNDFQTADRVIRALEDNKNRKFVIAGGFYKPHLPFVAPKQYWDLYSDDEIKRLDPAGLPKDAADFMYNWTEIASYGSQDGKLFSDDDDVGAAQAREMTHAYYACVSFIDAQVGRILDALVKNGLADNTAVVIWGDHGFHLGDHGRWAKHTQFEQAMRCPLIVRLPGQHSMTGETKAIVESVDIYPTLCDFAGLTTPSFVEGQSLVPIIQGTSNGKQAAFSQIRPVNRKKRNLMAYSVRTKDFRYVQWCEPDNQYAITWRELYDHRTDPEETVSVIDDPRNAEVIRKHEELVSENYASIKENIAEYFQRPQNESPGEVSR
ncbi:sulfatase [Aporhodopirellula aestuarii]|uniref:Sulfatase n=1 Tax=Aporhodopirellula aestuarii TaxID=2950107 RepID=A0ABT0U6S5_9BACT|nr:sulfatase [Aporhodopirellula aestuarii]MCM2372652.1 sulfatase [Aporhodopirellula aestuarii]